MTGLSKEAWYEKMLKQFKTPEGVRAEMKRRAHLGKGTPRPGAGFAANRELASEMGKNFGRKKSA